MRKYVNIVGVGERRTSKRGWEYVPLSFTYEDRFTNGLKAATCNVGVDALAGYNPAIGDNVEMVMHESNFSLFVDAVL